ncbi:hypothetical protein ACTXT7_008915 [Hymenolepis weldensis]
MKTKRFLWRFRDCYQFVTEFLLVNDRVSLELIQASHSDILGTYFCSVFRISAKDLVPLKYHLTPRVRGMEVLLNNMSSHLHAVYDVTVIFGDENGSCLDKSKPMPGLLAYLTKPRTLHIHLQRCPIVDVPQDHDALRVWLSSRYALKDKYALKDMLFSDLEEVKKAKSRQPNVEEVKAAFLKNLSVSKVPNGFEELPRLRKRWLFTAFFCMASFTALLLFVHPWLQYAYFGTVFGTIFLGIPYVWFTV